MTCIRLSRSLTLPWAATKQSIALGSAESWLEPVLCPAGKVPTGWGFALELQRFSPEPFRGLIPPPRLSFLFTTMRPEPDGWDVGLVNHGSSMRGNLHVRCVNPQARRYRIRTRRVSRSVQLEQGQERRFAQGCPKGWFVLSPGWQTPAPDESSNDVAVQAVITARGSADYLAVNGLDHAVTVQLDLLCIQKRA